MGEAGRGQSGGPRVSHHEIEISYPQARFLRVSAAPLDGEAKESRGMALILHDGTEAREKAMEAMESERLHSLTLLAASVAHEIGNPLNALHIHLQLLTREVRKLGQPGAEAAGPEIAGKLEHYLEVARGEITRLDYIVTQFLQAIRPSPPRLAPASLE